MQSEKKKGFLSTWLLSFSTSSARDPKQGRITAAGKAELFCVQLVGVKSSTTAELSQSHTLSPGALHRVFLVDIKYMLVDRMHK